MAFFLTGYVPPPPPQNLPASVHPALHAYYPGVAVDTYSAGSWLANSRHIIGVIGPPAALLADYRFPQVPSATPTLEEYREAMIAAADLRTQTKIGAGVVWNGHTLSLSLQAQSNWTNLFISRTALTYPKEVSTKDEGAYSFATAAEVQAFYFSGLAHVNAILDAGRAIKVAATNAADAAALDAIELVN